MGVEILLYHIILLPHLPNTKEDYSLFLIHEQKKLEQNLQEIFNVFLQFLLVLMLLHYFLVVIIIQQVFLALYWALDLLLVLADQEKECIVEFIVIFCQMGLYNLANKFTIRIMMEVSLDYY